MHCNYELPLIKILFVDISAVRIIKESAIKNEIFFSVKEG